MRDKSENEGRIRRDERNVKGGSGAENTLVGAGFTYFGRRNAGF